MALRLKLAEVTEDPTYARLDLAGDRQVIADDVVGPARTALFQFLLAQPPKKAFDKTSLLQSVHAYLVATLFASATDSDKKFSSLVQFALLLTAIRRPHAGRLRDDCFSKELKYTGLGFRNANVFTGRCSAWQYTIRTVAVHIVRLGTMVTPYTPYISSAALKNQDTAPAVAVVTKDTPTAVPEESQEEIPSPSTMKSIPFSREKFGEDDVTDSDYNDGGENDDNSNDSAGENDNGGVHDDDDDFIDGNGDEIDIDEEAVTWWQEDDDQPDDDLRLCGEEEDDEVVLQRQAAEEVDVLLGLATKMPDIVQEQSVSEAAAAEGVGVGVEGGSGAVAKGRSNIVIEGIKVAADGGITFVEKKTPRSNQTGRSSTLKSHPATPKGKDPYIS